jgi:putative transport protein
MGVIGTILAISLMQKIWEIDYAAEAKQLRGYGIPTEPLRNITIHVSRPEGTGITIEKLRRENSWDVIFGRVRHGNAISLPGPQSCFSTGDLVTAVGTAGELERVARFLGEQSTVEIDLDRREFDFRRIFVSNPRLAGRRLRDLHLKENYGAIVSRIRRGDNDILPHGDTVLELGDRVRVISDRERMDEVSAFFGDSYRAVSEDCSSAPCPYPCRVGPNCGSALPGARCSRPWSWESWGGPAPWSGASPTAPIEPCARSA